MRRMVGMGRNVAIATLIGILTAACGGERQQPAPVPQHLVIITIDTLRADRVGTYGYAAARTPTMDGLARGGARFDRAFTTAPITLPAHASLLTGRYPPVHRSRHNGVAMSESVPTLASALRAAGFDTGAFVSAFPLDRRFGLSRDFATYDDDLPRGADRKPLNERKGADTVQRAITWLNANPSRRVFLWLHLFEPHAPYLDAGSGQPVSVRYDEEVAESDRLVARVLGALGGRAASTLVVVTADHGEAFGEHGESGHSVFVYDTTLRIPLIVRGPGVPSGRVVTSPVSIVDIAPTVLALLGVASFTTDGVSLGAALQASASVGDHLSERVLYAESMAPLLDFGWSPLRSVRDAQWKYIAAPRPELYDLSADPSESNSLITRDAALGERMRARVDQFDGPTPEQGEIDPEAARRLQSLGYLAGSSRPSNQSSAADPKDRIAVAARLSAVMAGEVRGEALIETLQAILKEDPGNPQAHLRLGYAELGRGRCDRAVPHLERALSLRIPSADAGLALADCRTRVNDFRGAVSALEAARTLEPGNAVVEANLGLLALASNDPTTAVRWLRSALAIDGNLLEARFALARALARLGRRAEATAEAQRLLGQLPPDAPQRGEVQRLLEAVK